MNPGCGNSRGLLCLTRCCAGRLDGYKRERAQATGRAFPLQKSFLKKKINSQKGFTTPHIWGILYIRKKHKTKRMERITMGELNERFATIHLVNEIKAMEGKVERMKEEIKSGVLVGAELDARKKQLVYTKGQLLGLKDAKKAVESAFKKFTPKK